MLALPLKILYTDFIMLLLLNSIDINYDLIIFARTILKCMVCILGVIIHNI